MRDFHKPFATGPSKLLRSDGDVASICRNEGEPGIVTMASGAIAVGSCLHCPNTPCVYFDDSEIVNPVLQQSAFSRSRDVCVFDAMSVVAGENRPTIDETRCTGCGLCVSRCPANAIHLNAGSVAQVNDEENDLFVSVEDRQDIDFRNTEARLQKANKSGQIRSNNLGSMEVFMLQMEQATLSNLKQKLFVRNLLLCLGTNAAISSVGDTNVRMDMWWSSGEVLWLTEIDFDIVSLIDSPRGVLDDIAVTTARNGLDNNNVGGMIICKEFPNRRSDYYHIVEDINKVLGVQIRTVSLAGLLILLWQHKNMTDLNLNDGCIATRGNESIASAFRSLLPIDSLDLLNSRYFGATK